MSSPERVEAGVEGRLPALAALGLAVFLGALDLTVVATLLPEMIADLGISLTRGLDEAAWIVHGYLVAYAVALPLMGRASDLYGRRAVLVLLLALFLVGSVTVARASGLALAVAGRAVQGLGAGALVPVALAAGGDLSPPHRRPVVYGLVAALDTLGWVLGPLYGSLFLATLGWRAVFYVNVPLVLAVGLAAWRALGRPAPARGGGRLDLPGAALAAVLLATLTLAFADPSPQAGGPLAAGRGSVVRWPLLAVALVALVALTARLRRAADPLLPPALFGRPAVVAGALVNLLLGAALMVVMVDVPVFVHTVLPAGEQPSTLSGLLLSAFTLPMAAATYLGGRLTARTGHRLPAALGALGLAAGLGVMALWQVDVSQMDMLPGLVLAGLGAGLVVAPVASAVIGQVGPAYRGAAASLVVVLRLVGMTVGLAGLTAWGLGRFRQIAASLPTPPLDDPDFARTLAEHARMAASQTLTETFLIAAALMVVALPCVAWLGVERQPAEP